MYGVVQFDESKAIFIVIEDVLHGQQMQISR